MVPSTGDVAATTVDTGSRVAARLSPDAIVEEVDRIAEEVRRRVHDEADIGYCVIQVEAAGSPAAHERTGGRTDSPTA
ncbi:MAG TPA: hypothetical protein VJP78_00780 [Thermoleophilia bacterium]|nr:hypothetical protein [Thermoleophilia bacterium]